VRAASGPEAVACIREGWIEQRLQDLQQGLLDKPVGMPSSRSPPPRFSIATRLTGCGW
jgi:hypothetical protein